MATCLVSGKVVDPSGTSLSGVAVDFNIQTPTLSADPVVGSTTTATDGTWSMSLLQGLSGIFTMSIPPSSLGKKVRYGFNVNIPAASTANFSSIVVDS